MNNAEITTFMKRALEIASKGTGMVSPNPLVGAVIVKNGNIIAEGFHQKFGGPHAEIEALKNLPQNIDLSDATLICNLEPCCHLKKKTPPCTQALIKSGVGEVIVANLDPNPEVSGKGLKQLEEVGIKTKYGFCHNEGEELNRAFFTYMRKNRPFIHLKVAQTLDGKICSSSGDSKWISSELSRTEVHRMRMQYDAVAVGMGTVKSDNPSLTIRMGVENRGKVPYRLVFGNPQSLQEDLNLLKDEHTSRTWIFCQKEDFNKLSGEKKKYFENKNIQLSPIDTNDQGEINLMEVMDILGKRGIISVLVEGGSQLMTSFINSNLYDRMTIFMASKLLGNGKSFYDRQNVNMEEAFNMNLRDCHRLGQDVVIELERQED